MDPFLNEASHAYWAYTIEKLLGCFGVERQNDF
jgi:hypothetical protein